MRTGWVAAATVAVIIVSGCGGKQAVGSPDDAVREAVFRYQFQQEHSALPAVAVYCLSVSDRSTDPTDDFMKRFNGHKPPVKNVSECDVSAEHGVSDKVTGERGLILRVSGITWRGQSEATVQGSYYASGDAGAGYVYQVRRQGSAWIVTEEKGTWISDAFVQGGGSHVW